MTADWQRGYSLEHLRGLAGLFRERHKPLVFGAFGLTRERDIAQALAEQRFAAFEDEAAVIFRRLKRPGRWVDFRGLAAVLPAGAFFVDSFACRSHYAGVRLLGDLLKKSSGNLFVEIFEEDQAARAALRGFVWLGSKIEAGSEVKGLYQPGVLPSGLIRSNDLEPEEAATLSVLEKSFLSQEQRGKVAAELAKATKLWEQHYSSYNKRKSWTSFALRGYDDDPHFIIKPAEMSKSWKEANPERLTSRPRWTKAARLFPETRGLIDKLLPGLQFDRVRFMRLRAKDGELSRHADITDREAGVADGKVTRLHVPIITSDAVTFFGWSARGERLERCFPSGSLCYLDQRKPHAVRNEDPSLDRVHLVVDCFGSEKLRQKIRAAA